MQIGDKVTLNLGNRNDFSNTYKIVGFAGDMVVINHPLAPKCHLIKETLEIDQIGAVLKNPFEKCLDFCVKNQLVFSYSDICELEAICLFVVVNKETTPKQRATVNSFCGKISSRILKNSLSEAAKIIIEHKPLLDEFNLMLFNSYERLIKDTSKVYKKNEKFAIFELAGFLLAQEQFLMP